MEVSFGSPERKRTMKAGALMGVLAVSMGVGLLVLGSPSPLLATNNLDLVAKSITVTYDGGGYFMIRPVVGLDFMVYDTEIEYDVKIEIGAQSNTHTYTTMNFPYLPGNYSCYGGPSCAGVCPDWDALFDCHASNPYWNPERDCLCGTIDDHWAWRFKLDPGTYTIKVTVDVGGDVVEGLETNNMVTIQYQVG